MAASPRFKVYDSAGVYQGAVKDERGAIVLACFFGVGAEVRDGHSPARVRHCMETKDIELYKVGEVLKILDLQE